MTNVRLQQIADKAGISVGNLAYHFPNKRAIVHQIDEELEHVITPILFKNHSFPHLIDFDNQLSSYYALMNRYAFYFLDVLELERAYPELHLKRRKYIQRMVYQIEQWIQQHTQKGTFNVEIQANQYQLTAHSIWMIFTFWMTQHKVSGMGMDNEGAFKEAIWNQLLPIFTATGLMEYEAIILPQLKLVNLSNF